MIGPMDIFVFLIVLGVLVFVHELGHFVAAKACGIYVDRFSLGMPPRIFGFKFGETDYCVGLLPIGGYVKMAGQEDAPLSEEERESAYGRVPPDRWFNKKPVWQRAIVLIAGPAMNIVLALAIYALMAGYGREVPLHLEDTRIGLVEEESPASLAPMYLAAEGEEIDFSREPDAVGWKTGDRIVSIDGKEITRFQDIMIAAILGPGRVATVEIERPGHDGEPVRYLSRLEPKLLDDGMEATRFGVLPFQTALIRHVLPDSPAKAQGLRPGDEIMTADGEPVDRSSFAVMVRKLPDGAELELEVLRDDEVLDMTLLTRMDGSFKDIAFEPRLSALVTVGDDAPPKVVFDDKETLRKWGLSHGDKVLSVNDNPEVGTALRRLDREGSTAEVVLKLERHRPFYARLGDATIDTVFLPLEHAIQAVTGIDASASPVIALISKEFAEKSGLQRKDMVLEIDGEPATVARLHEIQSTRIGETISIKVRRSSIMFGAIQKEEELTSEITVASIQQIGVVWGTKTVFRREAVGQIIPFSISETWRQVAQIGTVLKGLFTGNLSLKLLGGPVMIGDVVMQAFKSGIFVLLEITAVISVNLAVFNLLPLPVLDGGQLVFLLIEMVRRRPVSAKVVEAVQQAGFVLIIGLLVFVTFNDVSRLVGEWLP